MIARHEALPNGEPALSVYKDSAGYPTIGYGHKVQPGEDFSKGVTRGQAEALLRRDTQAAIDAVNRYATAPLSQGQFDALVSFAYNVGPTAFRNSTLRARIVGGHHLRSHDFTEYRYSGGRRVRGLLNRRVDEYKLFSKEDYGGGR